MKIKKYFYGYLAVLSCFYLLPCLCFAENIDVGTDGSKYSYGETGGWQNWNSADSGITVSTGYLSGYIWCENTGWVCLGDGSPANGSSYANNSATDYGVNRNQGTGKLSGYGWSENAGWVNFSPSDGGVYVSTTGILGDAGCSLGGRAWCENTGWVCFSSSVYKVRTSAMPSAPTIAAGSPDYTTVKWLWADNSSGWSQEDGFKVYSSADELLESLSADTTYYKETGLKRNTKYSRYVHPYNVAWSSGSSKSATADKKTQPCVWQEKTTTRTGPNAFGFEGDGVWTWKVPANGGSQVTITAYVQYNPSYGSASKPKFTLYNYGINNSATASVAAAGGWEKLTVKGTPTGKGVLFLKVEGFSTAVGAKYFVDDIQVNQP